MLLRDSGALAHRLPESQVGLGDDGVGEHPHDRQDDPRDAEAQDPKEDQDPHDEVRQGGVAETVESVQHDPEDDHRNDEAQEPEEDQDPPDQLRQKGVAEAIEPLKHHPDVRLAPSDSTKDRAPDANHQGAADDERGEGSEIRHPLDGHEDEEHPREYQDRKSTRLNSSHSQISYAVFCLKKKKNPPSRNDATQSGTRGPAA